MDVFDCLPDPLVLLIINSIAEVKTLARLRSVSRRFNSLVPQAEFLLLRVDCIVSPEADSEALLPSLFRSFIRSIHEIFRFWYSERQPKNALTGVCSRNHSPVEILCRFNRILSLQMELPAGDLKLENGVSVKWRAEFGRTLKSCVILGFKEQEEDAGDFPGGLKTRVVWTISALIAASARHFMLREVVKEHKELRQLQLYDKEGEGVVVMKGDGLHECRGVDWKGDWNSSTHDSGGSNRTLVPNVRMNMRHAPRVRLGNKWVLGASLVVVRPVDDADTGCDAELALGAFDSGDYTDAIRELLKGNTYLLEMNSF